MAEIRAALAGAQRVIVLDRADSPGGVAPLGAEIAATLYGSDCELERHVYGLGGRDLGVADVRAIFAGGTPNHFGVREHSWPA